MPLLSRDEILAAHDILTEEVPVPEWGGSVLVRGLTGRERKALSESILDPKGNASTRLAINLQIRLPALCMVDESGKRLFEETDVTALADKNSAALKRVFDVAARLSGLSDDDVAEMAKKSVNGQKSDSGTD